MLADVAGADRRLETGHARTWREAARPRPDPASSAPNHPRLPMLPPRCAGPRRDPRRSLDRYLSGQAPGGERVRRAAGRDPSIRSRRAQMRHRPASRVQGGVRRRHRPARIGSPRHATAAGPRLPIERAAREIGRPPPGRQLDRRPPPSVRDDRRMTAVDRECAASYRCRCFHSGRLTLPPRSPRPGSPRR